MNWEEKLSQQRSAGLWRETQPRQSPQAPLVQVKDQALVNFNSNDYLGLSNHPEVIQAFKAGVDQYGVGSGSAQTLSGYTGAHEALRNSLKSWLKRDEVILFPSGYQANLAVLTTLISAKDQVFADKLNHASLIDGMLFSGAKFTRYPHLDVESLEKKLKPGSWVITESLFSMDGDTVDIKKLISLCESSGAVPLIDEAHSLGLYGPEGAGYLAAYEITQSQAPLIVGTFGKAIGTQGAFVAGERSLIDTLAQFARPYLFTTAMAPALAQASVRAIELIREADQARAQVQALIQAFREKASKLGLRITNSSSVIQPIIFDEVARVNYLSEALKRRGFWVSSIRYPTVALDEPRLRISLTANHTQAQIGALFNALEEALDEETSYTSRL